MPLTMEPASDISSMSRSCSGTASPSASAKADCTKQHSMHSNGLLVIHGASWAGYCTQTTDISCKACATHAPTDAADRSSSTQQIVVTDTNHTDSSQVVTMFRSTDSEADPNLHGQAVALDLLVALQVLGHARRVVLRVLEDRRRCLGGVWGDHGFD